MQVHDFVIYPRKLWIGTEHECLDNFTYTDETPITLKSDEYDALVVNVMEKGSLKYGYFMVVKEPLDHSTIGHEATHIALELFKDMDIDVDLDNQEPLAYLIGFICKCISTYK